MAMTKSRLPITALAALLLLTGSALACSDHEDPAVARDRLAANYPGALDILPVVAAARREKLLPPANPMAALFVDKFPLPRHIREIQRLETALNAAAGHGAPLVFSLVMVEPMLWTRFAGDDSQIKAEIHTNGPHLGELVVIAAEDVIAVIGDGRLSIGAAHTAGLLGLHGNAAEGAKFLSLYGGARSTPRASLSNP
jgi:hypothetical protein